MSFYNLVHGGVNPLAGILMKMLGFESTGDVGRFRDAYITNENDELRIAVYTRNGAGNREHWNDESEPGPECDCTGCIQTHRLPKHEFYLFDRDDDFDPTYATNYFRIPDKFKAAVVHLVATDPAATPPTPAERWQAFFEKLSSDPEDPDVKRVTDAIEPVIKQIVEALEGQEDQKS